MAPYRMVQELAQNIGKHAREASEASLELETMAGWVLLRAEDNGTGNVPRPPKALVWVCAAFATGWPYWVAK
jgi:signal transduction histidine kinase